MDLMIVLTVSVFFLLSLIGAYILFKWLESSAVIQTPRYRAGGALAGFVLIYGMLYGSYYKMANQVAEQLAKKQGPVITGTVSPKLEGGKIVLGVVEKWPDSQGHFKLNAPFNLDLKKDEASVYLISPSGERLAYSGDSVLSQQLDSSSDLQNIVLDGRLEAPEQETAQAQEGPTGRRHP